MAENLVVNDVTYPEVEAVSMTNEAGEKVAFYPDAVRYNPQTLTEAQKAQARTNMGAASAEDVRSLSAEKVSKDGITLGLHSDNKYYIFVDGEPVGTGFELSGNSGDVFGYVDANNNIVLNGNLADGSYSIKYEMDNGDTIDIGDLVLDSNVYYSVINTLTNCTNSNNANQIAQGSSYTATITATDGYELSSVTVTMGGNPVTVSNGVIDIASVTGNIVITAVAEVAGPAYTNQIQISIGTDGKPFNNGQGYKTGYRLSLSGGGESAQDGTEVTGFIPVTTNSVIRIKNIAYVGDTTRGVVGYDANFTKLTTANGVPISTLFKDSEGNGVMASSELGKHTHFNSDNLKYIRLCSTDINANSIITVDQEIV